jgi:oligopeptide transport system ATP-binding protein
LSPSPDALAGADRSHAAAARLLEIRGLKVYYPIIRGTILSHRTGDVRAVDGVTFSIDRGETLGLVGESGSGKSTIGRAIIRLIEPTSGSILFEDRDLSILGGEDLRRIRQRLAMVFQDPYGSLNPRMPAGDIVGEPLIIHGMCQTKDDYRVRVADLLGTVGLSPAMAEWYPHEFSGGQRQRLGVARALAVQPRLVILDEPVSALDVSIQAQVINLLQDLQERFHLAYLFIAHDLSVVRHISHRVAVMYLGKIVETAGRNELYQHPLHPYTQALLSAVPVPDPILERKRERVVIAGDIPSPADPPSGCVFHTRCPLAIDACRAHVPELREVERAHRVACLRAPGYGPY